jgi:hydroxymethylpyrimidine pyrophosphatase-like HAD family hydrolase
MNIFSSKIDGLIGTIGACVEADLTSLKQALDQGLAFPAYAIGSGGSLSSASYFQRCRQTLSGKFTHVCTPLEFILLTEDLVDAQVWLFSAHGQNPDVLGALHASASRQAKAIQIVTASAKSALVEAASAYRNAFLHIIPVNDPKDGFLATHSLVGTIVSLLRASASSSPDLNLAEVDASIIRDSGRKLSPQWRSELQKHFASLKPSDTLLLLSDPRLSPGAVTIETSVWETALCAVQRTDLRNFAHGRHVWLQHRARDTLILSMTGTETAVIWEEIENLVSPNLRRLNFAYGNCGRFQNMLATIDALLFVEAMGKARDLDPARPGHIPTAKNIYQSSSIERLSRRLTPPVLQKQSVAALSDNPDAYNVDIISEGEEFHARLCSAKFGGMLLDYDGTLVVTERRFAPPEPRIVAELERLLNGGIRIAFATGRGGSAGEALREVISPRHHAEVLIGYYNGAHIRLLSDDLRLSPIARHPDLNPALAWIGDQQNYFSTNQSEAIKHSGIQITILKDKLNDSESFFASLRNYFAANRKLKLLESQHTIDICLSTTCKTNVMRTMTERLTESNLAILCVGDSGSASGNDYALLGSPYGVSVHQVCGRPSVCWSLFGSTLTGPDALLRILEAMRLDEAGGARLALDGL